MSESKPVTFELAGDPKYRLVGTFTRYSSWTARAVTVLEYFKIGYVATYVKLPDVRTVSKSGLVPLLVVPQTGSVSGPEFEINDSLAICEFLAESHPELALWPRDPVLRALARSAAAEMHSGFTNIRGMYNSNFVARFEGMEAVPVSEAVRKEMDRIFSVWKRAREVTKQRLGDKDEGFLFGGFGIVDAFFWPVLWIVLAPEMHQLIEIPSQRFRSYSLPLTTASDEALAWMEKMWSDPTLMALGRDYFKQAEDPQTLIEKYDNCFADRPGVKYATFEADWKFTAK